MPDARETGSRAKASMMRVPRPLMALFAIALSSSFAAVPATGPADPDAELDQVLPDVRLGQVSFALAVDALRDRSRANLFVNWARLAQVGITPELKVELSLHDVTLRQAVVKVVEAARVGGAMPAWGVRDGIITISTSEDLGPEPLLTRFYRVEDILEASVVRAFPPGSQPGDAPADPKAREKLLLHIVFATITPAPKPEPRAEEDRQASVQVWAGRLVVTATRDDHRTIRGLLHQFREPH